MTFQIELWKTGSHGRTGERLRVERGDPVEAEGLGRLHAARTKGAATRLRLLPGDPTPWLDLGRKMSSLGHPNVVAVLGGAVVEGQAAWLEEQPDGIPLRAWVRRQVAELGRVSLVDAEAIGGAVLAALQHAHGAGVRHGGLDADCVNVVRDPASQLDVRVSGFGLLGAYRERHLELPRDLWETLAPELVDGAAGPTEASDLFAFAVLMLEVLTGELRPKGQRTPWREACGVPAAQLSELLRAQRADVPLGLWSLLRGLLAQDPAARTPKTARDLMKQMRAVSWKEMSLVPPPSMPQERGAQKYAEEMKRAPKAPSVPPRQSVKPVLHAVTRPPLARPPSEEVGPPTAPHPQAELDALEQERAVSVGRDPGGAKPSGAPSVAQETENPNDPAETLHDAPALRAAAMALIAPPLRAASAGADKRSDPPRPPLRGRPSDTIQDVRPASMPEGVQYSPKASLEQALRTGRTVSLSDALAAAPPAGAPEEELSDAAQTLPLLGVRRSVPAPFGGDPSPGPGTRSVQQRLNDALLMKPGERPSSSGTQSLEPHATPSPSGFRDEPQGRTSMPGVAPPLPWQPPISPPTEVWSEAREIVRTPSPSAPAASAPIVPRAPRVPVAVLWIATIVTGVLLGLVVWWILSR